MAQNTNFNLQICRFDGNNTFVEVMSGGFQIGKVNLNFIQYNNTLAKGSKQTQVVKAYMDIEDFLLLSNDILNGRIHALAQIEKDRAKANGIKYPNAIWTKMGGQSAKRAGRDDGKALSRQIKIIPGDKRPFLLQAEQGIGEESATGLIVPKYGNNPEQKVMIPMNGDDLKKLALIVKTHIEAFYSAVYCGKITLAEGVNGQHTPKTEEQPN